MAKNKRIDELTWQNAFQLTEQAQALLKQKATQRVVSLTSPREPAAVSWFNAVLEFINMDGGQVVTGALLDLEQTIIDAGLSEEYLNLLTIHIPNAGALPDAGVYLLGLRPEVRAAAALTILGLESQAYIQNTI